MPFDISVWTYLLLFVTALVAGWVDSIAGGGGLITIPVLLACGMPPQMVLGTNKFQASFGSFTAAAHYYRKGIIAIRSAVPGILSTLVGAAAGTWAVQQIDPAFLSALIPVLLLLIALYTLFTPKFGIEESHARMRAIPFFLSFGLLLGFYDGFFGPGVGSFWAVAFILLQGYSLMNATGYTKVMNFTSNVVSLVLFIIGGHVIFMAGVVMAVGQILGSRIGAGMVVTKGARFVRPIFITIVIAGAIKLLVERLR